MWYRWMMNDGEEGKCDDSDNVVVGDISDYGGVDKNLYVYWLWWCWWLVLSMILIKMIEYFLMMVITWWWWYSIVDVVDNDIDPTNDFADILINLLTKHLYGHDY